jgi:hypothetical protein
MTLTEEQIRTMARNRFDTREKRMELEKKYGYQRAYITGLLSDEYRMLPWWMLKELGVTKKKITVYEVTE